jgi:iron complex outermembrane receptor protein
MTLRSEYSHQFGKYEGFVRGLVRYIPPSYNLALDKHISSYTPVDLYVGLRNPDQQWELSLWAQNLFDKSIDRGMNANYEGGYAGGYSWLRTAPEERKVGVTLRYNFGQ